MAAKKRGIVKSAAVTKNLETALAALGTACVTGDRAVTVRSQDGKRFAVAAKRLSKKRAASIKRKRLAAKRAKASPSGETRKALRGAIKELATTKVQLAKARVVKGANAVELAALKAAQRRAAAYAKAIVAAEVALRRAGKKKRR